MPADNPGKKRVSPVIVVLAIVLVACVAGGVCGGLYLANTYAQIRDVENAQAMVPKLPEEVEPGQGNPIDFASLQAENDDIYAWVYLPDTSINYPVCQSAEDDAYYLDHDASRAQTELGAIYSESRFNGRDMQDRVTVLYGHNGFGDTMFTDLHRFERADYFDAHDKLYVYVPGHIYTYEIMSAFMSDDRHLMGQYNFQTESGFSQFLADMQNPSAIGANTRTIVAGADCRVLVLSTCNTGALESVGRYLVCGVMVDDQPTA